MFRRDCNSYVPEADDFPEPSDHPFFATDEFGGSSSIIETSEERSGVTQPTEHPNTASRRSRLRAFTLASLTGTSLFGLCCYGALYTPLIFRSQGLQEYPQPILTSKPVLANNVFDRVDKPPSRLPNVDTAASTAFDLPNPFNTNYNDISLDDVFPLLHTFSDQIPWRSTGLGQFFLLWINKSDRSYRRYPTEVSKRFAVFLHNLHRIEAHNKRFEVGLESYTMAPNDFIDLTPDEFAATHLTARQPLKKQARTLLAHLSAISNDTLPKEVDWIDKGCVTPVKNQLRCGSCWAFSTTGAVEGAICATTGMLLSLSEQQLVDCASAEGNAGCNGGFMDNAFEYILDAGGLCTEADYPYEGKDDTCRTNECTPTAQIVEFADIPPHDTHAIKAALYIHGPVSVGIEADKHDFQFYHDGVFNLKCGKQLNHAVLIVGYGEEESGEKFWLVKNSWGNTWGHGGYIKISRKKHHGAGECGILLSPTVPLVAGDHYVKSTTTTASPPASTVPSPLFSQPPNFLSERRKLTRGLARLR